MKLNRVLSRCLLTCCSLSLLPGLLCAAEQNSQSAADDRWFEVEVILFKQLADNSTLKEHFSDDIALSRQRSIIELLAPYLQPDISSLKQLMPVCGAQAKHTSLIAQATVITPFPAVKSLSDIKLLSLENSDVDTFAQATANADAMSGAEFQPLEPENIVAEQQLLPEEIADEDLSVDAAELAELTTQQQQLLQQAQQWFDAESFNLSQTRLQKSFCVLPAKVLSKLAGEIDNFDPDGFPVNAVPEVIDGAENLYSKRPYLISKESLKLTDIVKQLKRSKNFRPLLHLGWREAPKTKSRARAVHIFAGDNLQANYQQQLKQYQQAIAQEFAAERGLQAMLNPQANDLSVQSTADAQQQQLIKQHIKDIIKQSRDFQLSPDTIIAQLDAPDLARLKLSSENTLASGPKAPLQDWSLEGFIKINLDHYLYITAEFNVINQPLVPQASDELSENSVPVKAIHFSQNRRVISQEIHYFDHPYVGMIMQIRAHDRPKPPIEPAAP